MDRGLMKSAYPVINRPRLTYAPNAANVFYDYKNPTKIAFECVGDYLTPHSLSLTDIFVSKWFAIVQSKWQQTFNEHYPSSIPKTTYKNPNAHQIFDKFRAMTPLLNGDFNLEVYQNYLTLRLSLDDLRQHPAFKSQKLELRQIHSVIDRTAKSKLKLHYTSRILKKRKNFEYRALQDNQLFDEHVPLFEYSTVKNIKRRDGRVQYRTYEFRFESSLIAKLMIHNTIFGGFFVVPYNLFECSPYSQLLYRFVCAAKGRNSSNHDWDINALCHFMGLARDRPGRKIDHIESLLKELNSKNLIENVEMLRSSRCKFTMIL